MVVEAKDTITWRSRWKIEKYRGDLPREIDRYDVRPYEVVEGEGNLLLNEGINELFKLIGATGGVKWDNSNARIGVGDSNAAAAATQTDLQGGTTKFVGMDATFPTTGANEKAVFRATFGSADANFAWEEWTIDNGAVGLKNLNRKVITLGTKVSGTTWVFTVEISLS